MCEQNLSVESSAVNTQRVALDLNTVSDGRLDSILANCVGLAHRKGPRYMRVSSIFNTNWGGAFDPDVVDRLTASVWSCRRDNDLNWTPIFVIFETGFYWVCKGNHRLSAFRKAGRCLISVCVVQVPNNAEARLSSRVKQGLYKAVQQLQENLSLKTLLAQCVSIKSVYDEIRTEKVFSNTRRKATISEKPTLREVAVRMFPGWPNNLGSPDVSILLLHSRSTVETYWKNISVLVRANRALERLHCWERQGYISSWRKSDLANVGDYTAEEVERIVATWAAKKVFLKTRALVFPGKKPRNCTRKSRHVSNKHQKPSPDKNEMMQPQPSGYGSMTLFHADGKEVQQFKRRRVA